MALCRALGLRLDLLQHVPLLGVLCVCQCVSVCVCVCLYICVCGLPHGTSHPRCQTLNGDTKAVWERPAAAAVAAAEAATAKRCQHLWLWRAGCHTNASAPAVPCPCQALAVSESVIWWAAVSHYASQLSQQGAKVQRGPQTAGHMMDQ